MSTTRKVILAAIILVALGFIVIQLLPFGERTNPPARVQIVWDSPETEALLRRACLDCHSNETVWPWYSQLAPVSWLVSRDVRKGRDHWNASEEPQAGTDFEWIIETIESGEMPPRLYLLMHPEAALSEAARAQLITGVRATFGAEGGDEGREASAAGESDEDDD